MTDGLYQVTFKGICAGFSIRNGKIKFCAPILKARLDYWKHYAKIIWP
jgi:hypothetical protein